MNITPLTYHTAIARRQIYRTPAVAELTERVEALIEACIGAATSHETAQARRAVALRAERLKERGDRRPWITRAVEAAIDLLPS